MAQLKQDQKFVSCHNIFFYEIWSHGGPLEVDGLHISMVPAALLLGPLIMKSKRVKCSCCTPFKNPCCYSLLHLCLYTSTLCDGPSSSALPRQKPTLGWYGFAFSNAFFSNVGTSDSSHSSGYGAADPKTFGGNSVGHHRI